MMTKYILPTLAMAALTAIPAHAAAQSAEMNDENDATKAPAWSDESAACNVTYSLDAAYIPGDGYDHRAVLHNKCNAPVVCSVFEHDPETKLPRPATFELPPGADYTVLVSEGNERSGFDATVLCGRKG